MTRFVKDILDVKNVLGAKRIQPIPAFDPDKIVLRAVSDTVDFTAYYNGDIDVTMVSGGVEQTGSYDNSYSGVQIGVSDTDIGSYVKLSGDIYAFRTWTGADLLAVSNTVTGGIAIDNNIKILDLRNADQLTGISTPIAIDELYANAKFVYSRTVSINAMSGNATPGIVWVDPDEPYADDVITYANNNGWTVRYL